MLIESSFWNIIIIIFLVLFNGFFVASEFALVRVRASRIRELISLGSKRAKRVQQISSDLNRTTSSAQLGITLASIALGFIAEEFFSRVISNFLNSIGVSISDKIVSIIAFLVGYMIITYMHVTLGELLPKMLSIQYTEKVALICAEPLYWFMFITSPLLNFFIYSANTVAKLFGVPILTETHIQGYTEEELKIIIQDSIKRGVIEEYESQLIFNILQFTDKSVKELLTPRIDIKALPVTCNVNDIFNLSIKFGFSRLPIYETNLDKIIGFVHIKDTIPYLRSSSAFDITKILRKLIFVHEGKPVDDLLKEMQQQKTQVAIIVDEYGSVEGLVTLEDLIEAIIGPIEDEFDPYDHHDKININEDVISVGGLVSIKEFNQTLGEQFDSTIASEDSVHRIEGEDSVTLAGYVLELFESEIPKVGEEARDSIFKYKITQMTGNRIDVIEVRKY